MLLTVGHFISQDATQFGIDLLVIGAVADTADVEVRAVTDVKLILLRPMDEVMIAACGFHRM